MKLKIKTRDKSASWHGGNCYTLSLYLEALNAETRDRVWTAIEKALPEPEEKAKGTMGIRAPHES